MADKNNLGIELLNALGIDSKNVISADLHIRADAKNTIDVVYYVPNQKIGDGLATEIKCYEIKEIK